ncbi:MAG: glyoxalase superfamily protein [Sciscionella sp.]
MQVSVVPVPVADQDRAKVFYLETLGFTVTVDAPFGEGERWLMVRPSGGGTELALTNSYSTFHPGSLQGLMFEVVDVDSVHAALAERGVDLGEGIVTVPWGRFIRLQDPDGNGLILQQSYR